MNIEEFLESASAKKPVASEETRKPIQRASKPVRRVTSSGATIGDGMRTTAKVAAVTTVFTILLHSAPMLFAAIFGGIMFMKGCNPPAPIPLSSALRQSILPSPTVSAIPSAIPKVSPRMAKEETEQAASLLGERELLSPELNHGPLQEAPIADLVPEQPPQQATPLQDSPRFPVPAQQFSPFGMGTPSSQAPLTAVPFMAYRSASPELGQHPVDIEDAAIFDFRPGKSYFGTCQMPGAESKRMSLSVDSIRDRGTSIQARLRLLESPRTSKKYSGTVENNPPRLILTPVSEGNGFGTFLTYMPWYSNSPTTITLEMGKDGMRLEGTSVSSEQFDLVARSDMNLPSRDTTQTEFNGFDKVGAKESVWNIQKIDSKTIEASNAQVWSFKAIEEGVGTFVWTEGDKALATGTYNEDINENSLDIITMRGSQQRVFHALVQVMGNPASLQVCVPKEADTTRPKRVSSENGRIYEIVMVN